MPFLICAEVGSWYSKTYIDSVGHSMSETKLVYSNDKQKKTPHKTPNKTKTVISSF